MNGKRQILHSDLNAFYASVEMLHNPVLRGKAIAVCGATEDRHGIVLAKSEKAKKAGVRTGMVNYEAKGVCPDLILVPPNYERYLMYSRLTHEIYYRYTDLVEPFGMDECFLDVSGSRIFGSGMEIAEKIRKATKEELGLTVSTGVSFNKVYAKLGSDMKKPDAITEITQDNFRDKVWPLPASNLLYVGPRTAEKLRKYGIYTIGELAATDPDYLKGWFGVWGPRLWTYANGLDSSRVAHKDFVSPVKSIGHGITCNADLQNSEEVHKVMMELAQDVGHRLRLHGLSATGVSLYIRSKELYHYQYQCRLPFATQLPCELTAAGFHLFRERYQWHESVRAVCIAAIGLVPQDSPEQISLFVDTTGRDRRARLEDAIESIRERFGKKSLTYGFLMGDLKMPNDGRELVRMPGMMYQ